MTCGTNDTCPPTAEICLPNGDGADIHITVRDEDGDFFDLTGAAEITFIVADVLGGTIRIQKTLTDADIQIAGNLHDIVIPLRRADTIDLVRVKNYYELTVENSGGVHHTVLAGIFRAPETMNKDLA